MDHGKLNPLSTLFYSLGGRRGCSRWGWSHSTIGLGELCLPLVLDWKDPGVHLVWCSLTFCLLWNKARLLEIPQQYPRSPRHRNLRASSELLLNLPQLPGRDAAEALMKQLQAGEGWLPSPGPECFLLPQESWQWGTEEWQRWCLFSRKCWNPIKRCKRHPGKGEDSKMIKDEIGEWICQKENDIYQASWQ